MSAKYGLVIPAQAGIHNIAPGRPPDLPSDGLLRMVDGFRIARPPDRLYGMTKG